jgi:DNA-binding response OmpR family regulator
MRVLIVEDEKDMAEVLKEGFGRRGLNVSLAFDDLCSWRITWTLPDINN